MSDDMRAAFEAWITDECGESSLSRHPDGEGCVGQYTATLVQWAWVAWRASANRFHHASGFSMQGGTCHLFCTADGLREHILEQQKDPSSSLHVCWVDRVVLHE